MILLPRNLRLILKSDTPFLLSSAVRKTGIILDVYLMQYMIRRLTKMKYTIRYNHYHMTYKENIPKYSVPLYHAIGNTQISYKTILKWSSADFQKFIIDYSSSFLSYRLSKVIATLHANIMWYLISKDNVIKRITTSIKFTLNLHQITVLRVSSTSQFLMLCL